MELAFETYGLTPDAVLSSEFEMGALATRAILQEGDAPLPVAVILTMAARTAQSAASYAYTPLIGAEYLAGDVSVLRPHTVAAAVSLERNNANIWTTVAQNLPRWSYPSRKLKVHAASTNLNSGPTTAFSTGWTQSEITSAAATGPDNVASSARLVTELLTLGSHRTTISGGTSVIGRRYFCAWLVEPGTCTFVQPSFGSSHSTHGYANFRLTGSGVVGTLGAFTTDAGIEKIGSYYLVWFIATASAATAIQVNAAMITSLTDAHLQSYTGTGRTITSYRFWHGEGNFIPDATLPFTTGSTSKATDVPIWTPSNMPTKGCIVVRGTLDRMPTIADAGIFQLDNGGDTNRIVASIPMGGSIPQLRVFSAGVNTATITAPVSLSAGPQWTALIAWSPGGVRFGVTGGGIGTASIALPYGLVRGAFGNGDAIGGRPLQGEILADYFPFWPSESEAEAILLT